MVGRLYYLIIQYKMHLALLSLLVFLCIKMVICSSSNSTMVNLAKPGCSSKCGDLMVSYPFGIGSNCSMNSWFNISCNASSHPPRISLSTYDYPLSDISLSNIRVRIPYISRHCDNSSTSNILSLNFSNSPFSLSGKNMLTSFGCSDFFELAGNYRQYQNQKNSTEGNNFTRGCASLCTDRQFNGWRNTYCPGSSCCQIPIPDGTVILNASVYHGEIRNTFSGPKPCSYSYLGSPDYLPDGSRYRPKLSMESYGSLSVILEWRIGTESCRQAVSNSTSFGCGPNAICIDPKPVQTGFDFDTEHAFGGYRCRCKKGYEGNPYLHDGCIDIDECTLGSPCNSTATCHNVGGSYKCECPLGFYGDGKIGCHQIPPQLISSRLSILVIGLISGAGVIVFSSLSFGLKKFVRKKKNQKERQKFFKQNGGLLLQQDKSENEGILRQTRIFTAKELEKATDKFNESRILGQGGQGTVYKGMLSDGKIVAIKKSTFAHEKMSKHVVEQFINEVVILSHINHRNVVRLLGCCLETRIPLLVYEFMPNGTLYSLIHGNDTEFPISWTMKLKIAAEVAGAIAYLHSATSVTIFHRDIKSSNILLDEKFVAKISDFGTSKSVQVDQTHLTTGVNGTFGYIDPEYFQSNQLTDKSDVYSFGVVLVELLTGLKPILASTVAEDGKSLVSRFLSAMKGNTDLESILQIQLSGEEEKKEILDVAELAKKCLSLSGKRRPCMKEVAMELEAVRKSEKKSDDTMAMYQNSMFCRRLHQIENSEYSWTNTEDVGCTSSDPVQPIKFYNTN